MFQTYKWLTSAVTLFTLGLCDVGLAQLYVAPNINSVQNYANPQTIDSRINGLAQQQRSAGYGGLRSPANSYLPSIGVGNGGPRIPLGANASTRTSKPFSSYTSAPTVSPYLNLFRTDLNTGSNFNYSTLVQPQLQQQQVNQQLERQALQANRRLQAIAAQSDYNPQGSKDEAPTGHSTGFNYYGHYYQSPMARAKKR